MLDAAPIYKGIEKVGYHDHPCCRGGAGKEIGIPAKGNEITSTRVKIGSGRQREQLSIVLRPAGKIGGGIEVETQRGDGVQHRLLILLELRHEIPRPGRF